MKRLMTDVGMIGLIALIVTGCAATTGEEVLVQQRDGTVFKATVLRARGDVLTLRKRQDDRRVRVGGQPPSFVAQDLTGQAHDLAAARGRVVVLHFWASWCPFCRKNMPVVRDFYERYKDRGVEVLSVSTDASEDTLRAFVEENKIPYPVIASQELADQYEVEGIPLTLVIDQRGVIRYRKSGLDEGFVAVVDQLLGAS